MALSLLDSTKPISFNCTPGEERIVPADIRETLPLSATDLGQFGISD